MTSLQDLPQDIIRMFAQAVYDIYVFTGEADTAIFQLARVNRNLRDTVLSILFPPTRKFKFKLPQTPCRATPMVLLRHRKMLIEIMARAEVIKNDRVIISAAKATTKEYALHLVRKEKRAIEVIQTWEFEAQQAVLEARERRRQQRRMNEEDNWITEMQNQLAMNVMVESE